MRWSRRASWDLSPSPLTRALDEAKAKGRALVDLTESNPTRCGLASPIDRVAELGHARGALYSPDSAGHVDARAAVAKYYADRGLSVSADRIVLCASTSEAYGWVFKLHADAGDEVLVPQPSYPLIDFLARLEDVQLVPYPLLLEEGFAIDLGAVERALSPRSRAIVLVHPNNPTGSMTRRHDALALERIASEHGLALVVDEVFGDYVWPPLREDRLASFVGKREALTFVLSGLSKVAALPQVKLSWIAVLGPEALAAEAMRRLEVVADTYLSVSTPVQLALPAILAGRAEVQRGIVDRVATNLAALDAAIADSSPEPIVRRLHADAGWYAMLEIARTRSEDAWIELLIEEESIVVHPGYFFDMPREGFLVVSLLPESVKFSAAVRRVVDRLSHP